ncbi:MAG: hypothetical protein ACRCX8_05485 [Sarcina sp.]
MRVDHNSINIYIPDIMKNIFRYAYENAEIGKIMSESEVEWFGEIFLTKNINVELHRDILFYLKKEKLYGNIINKTDKFIVLPDVFSERSMPNSFFNLKEVDENGIKDYGNRNIVILNGKVFELIDRNIDSIKFCYSGKLYYFYNSSNPNTSYIESDTPSLRVINTYKHSEFFFNNKFPVGSQIDGNYRLYLDLNNNILTNPTENYLTLDINYPFIEYDYNSDEIINKSTIHGLFSVNPKDVFIQEKIVDEREDKFIIHNREIVFTETILVIYKNGSYRIINDRDSKEFDRIDKHTIEFKKDDTVSKIITFFKPIYFDRSVARVDSLYDDVMSVSQYGFYAMKYYRKNTDFLYNWLLNKNPSLEELVEYGYKYDLDVLYAIQKSFPMVIDVSENNLYVTKTDNSLRASKQNQLFLTVPNMLNLTPNIFIDGVLYPHDVKVTNTSPDQMSIHMNITRWNPELNNILKNDPDAEIKIKQFFKDKRITVAYTSYIETTDTSISYSKEYKPLLDKQTPITLLSKSEIDDNVRHILFNNGRAIIWNGDESTIASKRYVYDVGMGNDCKVVAVLNRLKEDNTSIVKLNLLADVVKLTHSDDNRGVHRVSEYFSENCMLSFNNTGKLIDTDINVLDANHIATKTSFKTLNKDNTMIVNRLLRVNNIYGINLEIDYSKVDSHFNVGSFNEQIIERNPEILGFFKTSSNFLEDTLPPVIDLETSKKLITLVTTFGSCKNIPFNPKDYREFLKTNNIDIIDHKTLVPIESMIPESIKPNFKIYDLAKKVISNIAFAKCIGSTSLKPKAITTEMINPDNFDPQLKYYLSKEGIITGSEVKLILLDKDLEFTFTPEFNNPEDNDPTIHLTTQVLEMNYGYDKQANITTDITLPTQKLTIGGDDEN